MKYLTLDSSVFVAAIRKAEEKHKICLNLIKKIASGEYEVKEPYSILVEVVAAIKRRTGSTEVAQRAKDDLLSIATITFEDLIKYRAEEACKIAEETGARGMDAIVAQVSKENNTFLVSLDDEMMTKLKGVVKTESIENL